MLFSTAPSHLDVTCLKLLSLPSEEPILWHSGAVCGVVQDQWLKPVLSKLCSPYSCLPWELWLIHSVFSFPHPLCLGFDWKVLCPGLLPKRVSWQPFSLSLFFDVKLNLITIKLYGNKKIKIKLVAFSSIVDGMELNTENEVLRGGKRKIWGVGCYACLW